MVMKRVMNYLTALTFLLITLPGCFDIPEELILPEWDVELNIPITNKTYTLYDMFKPQSKYSLTSELNSEDFYLVRSDNFTSNSEVTDYIRLLDQAVVSQSFVIPANVPAQSVFVVFPDGIEIDEATFVSGFISFAIQNPSASAISSSIIVPGIKKPDGSDLMILTNVAAFSNDSVTYDLANHQYILPPNQPSYNKNSLQVVASANSQMTGSFENVNFYLHNFNFKSITGSLPRTSLGIRRTSSYFNLGDAADFRDKFFIKEGTLSLKSEYVAAHPNIFELLISDIKLIGIRNTGEEKYLTRNDGQTMSFRLINGEYNLTLNESNSNITEFISFLPDSIVISSEYILNPSDDRLIKKVTNQDSIKFSVQFNTKSIFAIKQTNYIDTLSIDISEHDREKIRDGVSADLNLHLENAIPIDAFLKATLTDENYTPLFTLTKDQYGVDSLLFLGGQVNSDGEIMFPSVTLNTIQLDSAKIIQLSNARYVILSTTANTKNATVDNLNPPTVQFKSSDWLNLKCYGKVKLRVNGQED
jgi:hypothetical protein